MKKHLPVHKFGAKDRPRKRQRLLTPWERNSDSDSDSHSDNNSDSHDESIEEASCESDDSISDVSSMTTELCVRTSQKMKGDASTLRWVPLPLLAEVNKHSKDIDIAFQDDGHRYWIYGSDENVVSTTTLIKRFFADFDPNSILGRIMCLSNRPYWENPTYEYFMKSAGEIKAKWSELGRKAAQDGTYNHEQIEHYYNGRAADFSRREHYDLFNAFHVDHVCKFEPYRTEMLLFHEELRITGSADMLYRNRETGKLVLVDWKFVKKLSKKNRNKQAKAPLANLDDTNFNKYALQLSIYRYILETEYDLTVEEQFLVLLHKKQKAYRKEPMPYLKTEVSKILDIRRQELKELTLRSSSHQ